MSVLKLTCGSRMSVGEKEKGWARAGRFLRGLACWAELWAGPVGWPGWTFYFFFVQSIFSFSKHKTKHKFCLKTPIEFKQISKIS